MAGLSLANALTAISTASSIRLVVMTKMIAPIILDTANTQIQIERNVIAYSHRKSPLKLLRDVVASIGLLGPAPAPPTDEGMLPNRVALALAMVPPMGLSGPRSCTSCPYL